jgi:hypothetical protein
MRDACACCLLVGILLLPCLQLLRLLLLVPPQH